MPDVTPADLLAAYGGVPDPENPSSGMISPAVILRAIAHTVAPGSVAAPPEMLPRGTGEDPVGVTPDVTARDYARTLSRQAGKPPDPLETMFGVAGGSLATFIGPSAKTFPRAALAEANRLFSAGKTAEEVRQATGINLNAAGQPQYEISDVGSRFIPPEKRYPSGSVPLESVFEHPALYEAYPEMRQWPVKFSDPVFTQAERAGQEVSGGLNIGTDPPTLLLNARAPHMLPPEVKRSTTLHEVGGHGVSLVEGWPAGGGFDNPEVLKAAQATLAQRKAAYEQTIQDVSNRAGKWAIEQSPNDPAAAATFVNRYFDLNPADYKLMTDALLEKSKYGRGRMQQEEQFKAYQSLAGEEQARNIQKRADFTAERLREIKPESTQDRPYAEQLVRYQPGARPAAPITAEPPRAGFQGDKERILDEYRAATGQPRLGTERPLLAPGEEDIAFQTGRLPKEAEVRIRQLQYDRSLARKRGEDVEGEAYAPVRNEIKRLRAQATPGEEDIAFQTAPAVLRSDRPLFDPALKLFQNRVMHTAEAEGKTPAQVLRDFIRGTGKLLSVTPAAVLLGQSQDRNVPEPVR